MRDFREGGQGLEFGGCAEGCGRSKRKETYGMPRGDRKGDETD